MQLIVNSQYDMEILTKENSIYFKKLFKTIFLMGCEVYNCVSYPQLLSLYNANKSDVEDLKAQQRYEGIIIRAGGVVRPYCTKLGIETKTN